MKKNDTSAAEALLVCVIQALVLTAIVMGGLTVLLGFMSQMATGEFLAWGRMVIAQGNGWTALAVLGLTALIWYALFYRLSRRIWKQQ